MKKIIVLCIAVLFMGGCVFDMNISDDTTSRVLVSIAVRNISCEIADAGDEELIRTLESVYESIKMGTIGPKLMAQLSELLVDRPTIAADIQDLVMLMGVEVEGGNVLGIEGISPELWATIEKAWIQGQEYCE